LEIIKYFKERNMEYSTIIYEKKDGIAKITLNRPDQLNALNATMRREFVEAVEDIADDESITVLITTGAGRAFSAGMDLKEPGGILQGMKVSGTRQAPGYIDAVYNLPIPTIAALNGFAITGGLELALAHDVLIASETAAFADTHARASATPRVMAQMLHRAMSETRARLASFTGNYISAQEAYHFGMVAMVVPPDELMPAAEKIAEDILSCDREVLLRIKYLMNEDRVGLETGFRLAKAETMHHRRKAQSTSDEEAAQRRKAIIDRGKTQQK
jgi:enoyl-CoA hydratase